MGAPGNGGLVLFSSVSASAWQPRPGRPNHIPKKHGTHAASPGLSGRCMICFSAKESCHAHPETQGVPRQPQHKVCRHFPLGRVYGSGSRGAHAHIGEGVGQNRDREDRRGARNGPYSRSLHIDLLQLRSAAGAMNVALASEEEFKERFPDCEIGAMPPFGNLYDMFVFADETLARDKEIAFNAGSHRELVRLAWEDFVRLVEPKIVRFAAGSVHSAAA